MHNKLSTLLFLWVFMLCGDAYAVPRIVLNNTNLQGFYELWDMQVFSDYSNSQLALVRVQLYNHENKLVYSAQSNEFLLQPGMYNLSQSQLTGIQIIFSNEELLTESDGQDLEAKIILYDPVNNVDIFQATETVRFQQFTLVVQTDSILPPKEKKVKKYFDMHGTVDLTGLYNNRRDTLFYLPFDYFRTKVNTRIDLFEIPFTYDMYVTTEQRFTAQNLNSYSFNFDYRTFQNRLMKKVSEKLQELSGSPVLDELAGYAGNYKNLSADVILDSLKNKKQLSQEMIGKYAEAGRIDSIKRLVTKYDDIQFKKYVAELNAQIKQIGYNKLDSLMMVYRADSLRNMADSMAMTGDSLYHQYSDAEYWKSYEDTLMKISGPLFDSLLKKYPELSALMADNKIPDIKEFSGMLNKIDKYSLDDLSKLRNLRGMVNEKIDQYKHHEKLKDIERLKNMRLNDWRQISEHPGFQSALSKYGLISRKEKILGSIRNLEFGTVYPYYSAHTINGVVLKGYNIAWNYKNFYIGSTGGKQLNTFTDSVSQGMATDKNILFGFVSGYGDKSQTHFHVRYVYGKKEMSGSEADSLPVSLTNHVIAPEIRLNLFKNRVTLMGEIPISITKTEKNISDTSGSLMNVTGYAAGGLLNWRISKKTELLADVNFINKNYTSLGLPFYTRDRLQSSVKMTHKIKEIIQLTAGYEYEQYKQFIGDTLSVSRIHSGTAGFRLGYRFFKLHIMYLPSFVRSLVYDYNTTFISNISGTIGFAYKVRASQFNTQVGANYNTFFQNRIEFIDNGTIGLVNEFNRRYENFNTYLINTIIIKKFNLSQQINFVKNKIVDTSNTKIIIFSLGIRHNLEKFRYAVSLQYANTPGENFRTGVLTTGEIDVWKYLVIQVKMQYDYLNGNLREQFYNTHGFLVSSGLQIKF